MHYGLNQNTNKTGQFPESIFTLPAGSTSKQEALIEQQRAMAVAKQNSQLALMNRAPVSNPTRLDRFEGMNAQEWEDVNVVSRRPAQTPSPATKSVGLSASRYAVLADEDEPPAKKEPESSPGTNISKEEISRLVDEKFAQILAAQQANAAAVNNIQSLIPTGPRSKGLLKEPLLPVNPKTNTCWIWATPNKGCRFTADECRDLHAHLPVLPSGPTNLRMGKPTWGAFADSLPPPTPIEPTEYKPGRASKTCYSWANDGKCEFTAETCKYLHGPSPAGVAPKPSRDSWKRIDWSRLRKRDGQNETETENGTAEENNGWGKPADSSDVNGGWGEYTPGEEDGDLVLEEVQSPGWVASPGWIASPGWSSGNGKANGSGESSGSAEGWGGSDDKYKPPRIKALEEKAQTQAAGW